MPELALERHGRPTRLTNTRLWGTNLKDADIDYCELHNSDNIDLRDIQHKVAEGKLKRIPASV